MRISDWSFHTCALPIFLPVSDEHPEMADVLADFEALGEDFAFDDVVVNAWAGVTIFGLAAEQANDLTGPSIRAALDSMGEFDIEVVPPLSFQAPVDGIPTFERTFTNQVIFNRAEDGRSGERRAGTECVSTGRSRWTPFL